MLTVYLLRNENSSFLSEDMSLSRRGLNGGMQTAPKRVFMCTECHKPFRSREELYLHAELCLLEAFEVEAANMMSDAMPELSSSRETSDRSAVGHSGVVTGITAKPGPVTSIDAPPQSVLLFSFLK